MTPKLDKNGSQSGLFPLDARIVLDIVPVATAIWDDRQTVFALNKAAQRLTGFSEADFARDHFLWSSRIHPVDKIVFSERQRKMTGSNSEITCDYRFYPKGEEQPIWLREVAQPFNYPGMSSKWISTYRDISDLKCSYPPAPSEPIAEEIRDAISSLFHEIKNRLHFLSMELELAEMESSNSLDCKKIVAAVHEVHHSIKALHDYLMPDQTDLSSKD